MARQKQHSSSGTAQNQKQKHRWPPSGLWIVVIIVVIVIAASIIATVLLSKDLSIEVTIISAVVIGLPGLMLGYFQWMHPRPASEQAPPAAQAAPLAQSSPSHVVPQAVPTSQQASATPSHSPPLSPTSTPAIPQREQTSVSPQQGAVSVIPQPRSADTVFFFNVVNLPSSQEFFGREIDRESLLNRTANRQATSLVGPRRIGKTWLIQYLRLVAPRQFGSRYRLGYLDASMPGCATVTGFTSKALKELQVTSPSHSSEAGLMALERAVEDLRAKGYTPILCIDEFERLSNSAVFDYNFFSGLRAIAHAGLGLVVASKSSLIDIVDDHTKTSPFFNIFEQLTLEPFDSQEAEAFVQVKGRQAGFTAREQAYLLQYGQTHEGQWPPLRLQLVGKLLLESKLRQQYHPDDEQYWQKFRQRLEDKYRGAVR